MGMFATGPDGERYYRTKGGLFTRLTHAQGRLIPGKGTQVAVRQAHRRYRLLSSSMCWAIFTVGLSIERLWTAFGGKHQAGIFIAVGLVFGVALSRLYASKRMARELTSFESVPVRTIGLGANIS